MEAVTMRKTVYDFARALPNRTTEIYQEERLRIASILNVLDELEPIELEMHKSVRHGTCTPINILFAARDFYALEALSAILCDAKANTFDPTRHSHEFWFDAFTEFRNAYAAKLATAIFDYTVSVAAGEMRHAKTEASRYIEDFPYYSGSGRYDVYGTLDEFEPYSVLAAASRVFSDEVDWESGFGGAKWKQIADAGLKRKVLSDVAFIDHCVDLSHNNSVYFDKGAGIFELAYAEEYRKFLDLKRHALPEELLWEIGAPIASLVRRAKALGIINMSCGERSGRNVDRVLCYVPIRWGTKYISTALGTGKFRKRKENRDCGERSSDLVASDFKVGDKVICLNAYGNSTLQPNVSTGTVVQGRPNIAVEWDERLVGGHSCNGACKDGHGWWLLPHLLKKVQPKAEFEVGDTVQLVFKGYEVPQGESGKVLAIQDDLLFVEWDNYVTSPTTGEIIGYCVTPECKRGHGWNVCKQDVIRVSEVRIQKPAPKIIAIPGEFEVGDYVMCVNDGQIYSLYKSWVERNAPQYLESWEKGKYNGANKICGVVVAMAPHTKQSKLMLYLVKVPSKGSFLIEKKGLAMVEKEVSKYVA